MGEWPAEKVKMLIGRLEAKHGPTTREDPSDPLVELVACILSQHTTDATSIPTFEKLRTAYPSWEAMASASPEAIAEVIRSAGLANQKARSIHRSLALTKEAFGTYSLERLKSMPTKEARTFLEGLPGVGSKTAAIVLCFALDRDVVPVDTHVYRVAVRLGLMPPIGEAKAHPLLDKICPPGYAYRMHMSFIMHGRTTCKATVPKCGECVLADLCAYRSGDREAMRRKGRMRYPLGANPATREGKRSQKGNVQTLRGQQNRERIGEALGSCRTSGLRWIDALPDSDQVLAILLGNDDALHRFCTIVESAPAIVDPLSADPELSDDLLKGRLEGTLSFPDLRPDESLTGLAQQLQRVIMRLAARWVIDPSADLAGDLSRCYDWFLAHICGRLCLNIDLLALGSYGTRDLTLGSDLDVAILVRDSNLLGEAEAATFSGFIASLRKQGAPIKLDFGLDSMLRELPGPLTVRTYDALKQYELVAMGMAERFGLSHARLIWGDPEADKLLQKTAYAVPLTPERLRELVSTKRRYEAESVQPKHRRRDIKRGLGGLSDIEWFVHLYEMRYPTATHAGSTVDLNDRIRNVANARLINSVERDELLEARRHLREVRHRLILMGFTRDVVPENPDRLSRLAHCFGYADGNDFLSYHERVTGTVRTIYEEGLERLKV